MRYLPIILVPVFAIAQWAEEVWSLNLLRPEPVRIRTFQFRLSHRFIGTITEDPLKNLFGMDLGNFLSLGFSYGLSKRIELTIIRNAFEGEYFLQSKVLILKPDFPLLPFRVVVVGNPSQFY